MHIDRGVGQGVWCPGVGAASRWAVPVRLCVPQELHIGAVLTLLM